jgi:hypothetical protein
MPRYLRSITIARILIGLVFLWNVQCAVLFLLWPERYAPAFELTQAVGEAMIQGMGVLFLMWNVPYAVALWHPVRYSVALFSAVVMQAIGLFGETYIYLTIPAVHETARSSVIRFILFDAVGLLLLIIAAWITWRHLRVPGSPVGHPS